MDNKKEGKRGQFRKYIHEIKLFTDKNEMILYVNSLTMVENVEVFKIEDQLYKVHVVRKNNETNQHECCHGENHKHHDDHECCQDQNHHHGDDHECCCGENHKDSKNSDCCKDKK
jgi:hypothetical protein